MTRTLQPARFQPSELTRPPARWIDVTTTLADFAIITFAVDPAALGRLLAPGFAPDIFTLADGSRRALVSAVPFRDLDFRFGAAPWLRFSFGQTNYRAYVTYRGQRGVWFFGTSLATPYVVIPRFLWKLPWHHARMRFDTCWSGARCEYYRLATTGRWGAAEIDLEGADEPMGCLDGFADEEETAVVLTHPLTGYFYRRDGRLGSYAVWHDRLRLRRGLARRARFAVFEQLGLVAPDAAPHSVLVQRTTEFIILLPPHLIQE
jgi:uncharacterized protein YqjF (DUF2071 family)